MSIVPKLHHVGIVVENLAASIAWYGETLGFEHLYSFSFPGVKAAFVGCGELRIEMFQNEAAEPMADGRRDRATNLRFGGINHFALEVENLDATIAELRSKGVRVASEPMESPNGGGNRFAFIHDNEDMLIELFEPA